MLAATGQMAFLCPACRAPMRRDGSGSVLSCLSCPSTAKIVADNLIDFLGSSSPNVEAILGWPNDAMRELEAAVIDINRGQAASARASERLLELGLVNGKGRLTQLGVMAAYNSSEFAWQGRYDPLEGLVEAPRLTADSRIMDLGCGSGQTLRRLFSTFDGTVIGVDCSIEILTYGSKLFSAYGLGGLFCCASAHALPFPDDTFDFIICRGVISYTRQRWALREAFRVLRPGASIFLRVESINWDLRALTHPTGPVRYLFDLRSLGVGLLCDLTGYQPMPGGLVRGPRAYVSRRRFSQIVHQVGGEVLRYASSPRGPQFFGRGTQDIVLCRKLSSAKRWSA